MRLAPIILLLAGSVNAAAGEQGFVAESPAHRDIAAAEARLGREDAASAGAASAWAELSQALLRRRDEVGSEQILVEARRAMEKSVDLSPRSRQARSVQARVLLAEGRFDDAREVACALNEEAPDDVASYGLLGDALLGLSRFDEAEIAFQWMLDIRPNEVEALLAGARMREILGDPHGALQFLDEARQRTSPADEDAQVAILVDVARLHAALGDLSFARAALANALEVFPQHPAALTELGKLNAPLENIAARPATMPIHTTR